MFYQPYEDNGVRRPKVPAYLSLTGTFLTGIYRCSEVNLRATQYGDSTLHFKGAERIQNASLLFRWRRKSWNLLEFSYKSTITFAYSKWIRILYEQTSTVVFAWEKGVFHNNLVDKIERERWRRATLENVTHRSKLGWNIAVSTNLVSVVRSN